MRLLTDDPVLAATYLPAAPASGWRRDVNLPPHARALMAALGETVVWSQEVESDHQFWSTVAVVSHSAGSQFDALDLLLRDDWPIDGPTAALALVGTGFRGQRQRTWEAARGNLHVSAAVPVALDVAQVGAALSMLPAIAAVDAIVDASDGAIEPGIKWVNDILIADRKVGGVLTAAHTTTRRVDHVVWGIGINVEVAPAVAPTPFVPATTCLHAVPGGTQVTVAKLFRALLDAIACRHRQLASDGSAPIFEAYRRHSIVIGRAVRVWDESGDAPWSAGTVRDIASDLSLLLEGQSGAIGKGRLELLPGNRVAARVDPAIVAAIAAAVSSRFPGARAVRIEDES